MKRIVKGCDTCRRHNDGVEMNSLARPTIVSGIVTKVGMDLVTGFPENDDGYIGCLVLTEYLSKYPDVYPIKSKTAEEIADCLLDYIGTIEWRFTKSSEPWSKYTSTP